jgi:hypothetical protein
MCVPYVARLEDEIARLRMHDAGSEHEAQSTLERERELILAGVEVDRGGETSRDDQVLDQGEPSLRWTSRHDELSSHHAELARDGLRRLTTGLPRLRLRNVMLPSSLVLRLLCASGFNSLTRQTGTPNEHHPHRVPRRNTRLGIAGAATHIRRHSRTLAQPRF